MLLFSVSSDLLCKDEEQWKKNDSDKIDRDDRVITTVDSCTRVNSCSLSLRKQVDSTPKKLTDASSSNINTNDDHKVERKVEEDLEGEKKAKDCTRDSNSNIIWRKGVQYNSHHNSHHSSSDVSRGRNSELSDDCSSCCVHTVSRSNSDRSISAEEESNQCAGEMAEARSAVATPRVQRQDLGTTDSFGDLLKSYRQTIVRNYFRFR